MQLNMKSSIAFCLPVLNGLFLVLTGCSVLKPKADRTEFYVLRAPAPVPENAARDNAAPDEVRIGPGRIAGYLDVTPIAVQDGSNRIRYLDRYRWAEPLSKGLTRILGENLRRALNLKQVTLYPDPAPALACREVHFNVYRFEGTLDGPVTLDVSWQLVQQPSDRVLYSTHSVYVVSATGQQHDPAAYVERLSESVDRWAKDIASAIGSSYKTP